MQLKNTQLNHEIKKRDKAHTALQEKYNSMVTGKEKIVKPSLETSGVCPSLIQQLVGLSPLLRLSLLYLFRLSAAAETARNMAERRKQRSAAGSAAQRCRGNAEQAE